MALIILLLLLPGAWTLIAALIQLAGVLILISAVLVFVFGLLWFVLKAIAHQSTDTGFTTTLGFDLKSRTQRQISKGHIGQAILMYAHAHRTQQIPDGVLYVFPPFWPMSEILRRAVQELADLQSGIPAARRVGVPTNLLQPLQADIDQAFRALAQSADLMYSLKEQKITEDAVLQPAIEREAQKVERLSALVHTARQRLAEWTLVSKDTSQVEQAEKTLRVFTQGSWQIK